MPWKSCVLSPAGYLQVSDQISTTTTHSRGALGGSLHSHLGTNTHTAACACSTGMTAGCRGRSLLSLSALHDSMRMRMAGYEGAHQSPARCSMRGHMMPQDRIAPSSMDQLTMCGPAAASAAQHSWYPPGRQQENTVLTMRPFLRAAVTDVSASKTAASLLGTHKSFLSWPAVAEAVWARSDGQNTAACQQKTQDEHCFPSSAAIAPAAAVSTGRARRTAGWSAAAAAPAPWHTCTNVVLAEVHEPGVAHGREPKRWPGPKTAAVVGPANDPLDDTEHKGAQPSPAQDLDLAHGGCCSGLQEQATHTERDRHTGMGIA